jgi:hypothetical protein
MKYEQINATIARIAGMSEENIEYGWVPDYCTDLNDLNEVLCNLSQEMQHEVAGIVQGNGLITELLTATARIKAEAVLRAHGKWEEAK